ncbi:MAG: glycosyltransferase family 2 protein, partial [Caulobacteraceae bacterium]
MTTAPLVSLIMANYNGARSLAEAIASAQRQTLADWELILVDDASTDDSLAIAVTLAQADQRIKVLAQARNRGPAAARNRALAAARGAWIAVVDSDDVMLP